MKLTNNPEGKYLYKFVPFNQYSLQILINNQLWLSPPDLLNDPFEGDFIVENFESIRNKKVVKIITGLNDNYGKFINSFLSNVKSNRFKFEEHLYEYLNSKIKNKFGTSSFSKTCKSLKMWSHYADSHKGFVIIFDRNILEEGITNSVTKMVDVEYGELPAVQLLHDNNDVDILNDEFLLVKKLKEWKNEQEVRVIIEGSLTHQRRLLFFPKESIVAIIFGYRIEYQTSERRTIINLLSERLGDIMFYNSHKNEKRNNMIFENAL